jgi:hypothetical protein
VAAALQRALVRKFLTAFRATPEVVSRLTSIDHLSALARAAGVGRVHFHRLLRRSGLR